MSMPALFKGRLSIPVIGSPLFIISVPDLVIAQCKAGVVGSFPALNARPASLLDEWIARIKEELAAWDKAHPDRLIPFCCLDPRSTTGRPERFGHVEGLRGMKDILKRYKDAGCKGFGEHKVGLPFDHKLMMTLYEACADLELPILFHLDDIRSFDAPGLPRLETALKAFP